MDMQNECGMNAEPSDWRALQQQETQQRLLREVVC
jgi:hypothetical protein